MSTAVGGRDQCHLLSRPPQGLCTCCSSSLEDSSSRDLRGSPPHFFWVSATVRSLQGGLPGGGSRALHTWPGPRLQPCLVFPLTLHSGSLSTDLSSSLIVPDSNGSSEGAGPLSCPAGERGGRCGLKSQERVRSPTGWLVPTHGGRPLCPPCPQSWHGGWSCLLSSTWLPRG